MPFVAEAVAPFRWNITKREQLGELLDGEAKTLPDKLLPEFREAAAKIVASDGNAELVFVGRSPENLFDYLSGAFSALSQSRSLTLLQVSYRNAPTIDLPYKKLAHFLQYMRQESLDPHALASQGKVVRFVDVVSTGSTFQRLVETLRDWSDAEGADWNVVSSKIGFVGLTVRGKNSPHAFRWQQTKRWREIAGRIHVKNVSLSPPLWHQLGNVDPKVTPPHRSDRWGSRLSASPDRDEEHLKALRGAVQLYDRAADRAERVKLSRAIAQQPQMSEPWLRSLVLELKTRSGKAS
ncbi:hypothetical protein [Marinobacter sp.]|uniref:hypothetical protein n=1 Tax=Marinobacter sp. TaxID=50741 RepID=UPI003297D0A2